MTYPYMRTVKYIISLQITVCVLFVFFFIKSYVWVLIRIASTSSGDLNEYQQHICFYKETKTISH